MAQAEGLDPEQAVRDAEAREVFYEQGASPFRAIADYDEAPVHWSRAGCVNITSRCERFGGPSMDGAVGRERVRLTWYQLRRPASPHVPGRAAERDDDEAGAGDAAGQQSRVAAGRLGRL